MSFFPLTLRFQLVFAGDEAGCSTEEFVAQITTNTAGLIFLAEKPGTLGLEELVEIGRQHDRRFTQAICRCLCFRGGC